MHPCLFARVFTFQYDHRRSAPRSARLRRYGWRGEASWHCHRAASSR